jgi:hypothetical protein
MAKSLPHAGFVFQGTVTRLKDATMTVDDPTKTVVVRVDHIIRAPQALLGHSGTEITLLPAKGERLKAGQTAIFHTNGWLYGKSMAVQSVGHAAVSRTAAAAAVQDPARAALDHAVAERVAQAPVAITGRVVAIGLPAEIQPSSATASRALPPPISEHDPFWSEAVVAVQRVHKGVLKQQQVVIRFPDSHDVRWHRSPKFHVGQEGVFLLRPDEVSGVPSLGVTAAAHPVAPRAYTCLHPSDFLPAEEPKKVAAALQAISTGE